MNSIKTKLYKACHDFVIGKEATVFVTIQSHQEALYTETKSSAGDKHETGRAMLQLEMEKASQQLEVVHTMKAILKKINVDETSEVVKLGSLVLTDTAAYFLSISAGEIKINDQLYYAVSAISPIGKLLIGKRAGEIIIFRKPITIKEVY